jgi:tripartite-type tricarboxylate transporter receptor subunit TctC
MATDYILHPVRFDDRAVRCADTFLHVCPTGQAVNQVHGRTNPAPIHHIGNVLRKAAASLVGGLMLVAEQPAVLAQDYPSKPVHAIVTMQAGPLDLFVRLITEKMASRLKQPFVVESRPGAGGNIAASAVAKADPNGLTVLFTNDSTFTVNPSLYAQTQFDPERDFIPVSVLATFSQMLVVNPKLPARSIGELVADSRKRQLNYSSSGNGTPSHLAFAYLQSVTGIQAAHIPYKTNADMSNAIISGDVDATMAIAMSVVPHARAGKVRSVAYSGRKRSFIAPEIPTMAELGYPDFEVEFAFALLVPARTPESIVATLHLEAARAATSPDLADKLKSLDLTPVALPPAESAEWLRTARRKWEDVIRRNKLRTG